MKKINSNQQMLYENYEKADAKKFLERYEKYIEGKRKTSNIRILDIGGASGYFASLLKDYFSFNNTEIYVLDPCEYDTWEELKINKNINFVCDSVENVDSLFERDFFDIVFVNRTFHHFVGSGWKETLSEMNSHMRKINKLLKKDGFLLILDHFYNGFLIDSITSFLIYTLTSIKTPFLASIFKKLDAKSAGVGVCFQSEKMWMNIIKNNGFEIMGIEKSEYKKLSLIKRVGLLCKKYSHDNIIFASPIKK